MPLDILVSIFERGYKEDDQQRDEDETRGNCGKLWEELEDIDEKKEAKKWSVQAFKIKLMDRKKASLLDLSIMP